MELLFNVRPDVSIENENAFGNKDTLGEDMDELSKKSESIVEEPDIEEPEEPDEQFYKVDDDALYYSLVFQVNNYSEDELANDLEKKVNQNVLHALNFPDDVAITLAGFSSKIPLIRNALNENNIGTFITLLKQEPILACEVLRLTKTIDQTSFLSLNDAVNSLDVEKFSEYLANIKIKNDIKPIYFRRYGQSAWKHSMQVAYLSSKFAEPGDEDKAFTIGLIHDIGKVAIFKILLDAFDDAELGEQPCSHLFRKCMTMHSLTLSVILAKFWSLPAVLIESLTCLSNNKYTENALAKAVWRANLTSEISMLKAANMLDYKKMDSLLHKVDLTEDEFLDLHKELIKFGKE